MSMCMFSAGTPPSALLARRAKLEEERASELLKAKHLREEVKRDPTLQREIELGAWQKLEVQRRYAFAEMEDSESQRITSLRSHKLFWAWRKRARMELRQLSETEQSSPERMAQIMDTFLLARENAARDPYGQPYRPQRPTHHHPGRFRPAAPAYTRAPPLVHIRSRGVDCAVCMAAGEAVLPLRDPADSVQA